MARVARKTKTVICILVCCVLLISHMGACRKVRAEALPDVLSGSSTIADIVLTYYSTVGAGISNIEWINTLNNSFGSNFGTIESFVDQGYLLQNDAGAWEPAQELVNAIENTSAYQSLGLDQIFNVSAQEAAAGGGLAASGAATLAGAAGGVASIGGVALFAGVSGAYWAGIGAGTLIAHLTGLYGKPIWAGNDITNADFLAGLSNGTSLITFNFLSGRYNYIYYVDGYKLTALKYDTGYFFVGNTNQSSLTYRTFDTSNSTSRNGTERFTSVSDDIAYREYANTVGVSNPYQDLIPVGYTGTREQCLDYISNLRNGSILFPSKHSPDVIGPNGNQQGDYDSENQKYTVPDFKPQIDPGTEAGKVLSLQDWLNFANGVRNNNSQVNPLPDNAKLFQDLIDALRVPLPTPGPSPDPGPGPTPSPTPVPDPDYGDPNPDQPDWEDPTEVPDPVDTGNPWRLPDLSKKFPFCIPWDIGAMFGKLKVNSRQAPHISWRFNPPNTPIDYTFDLDLEDYEEVATLLRSLELIAFIVGLAFATRYLIGAT